MPSASPTSARPSASGTRATAGRCTARSSGRTGAAAARCAELRGRATSRWSASEPGSCSTRTSRRRRSSGCSVNVDGLAERARDGRAVFGTVDAWLIFKLTGELATDPSNASRTLLFDIHAGAWDGELLELFGVPERALPSGRRRAARSGRPARRRCTVTRCPSPASPATSRRRCSARPCVDPGLGKNTYGTGLVRAPERRLRRAPEPADGLLTTVAWRIGAGRLAYALEAAIFVTGAAVQWLRDGLGIISDARRDRGARALAGRQRRRLLRAGADRARLAALGPVRPRDDRRADPGNRQGAPGAGGARVDRLPDRRRGAGDRAGLRSRRWRSCAPTAARASTTG